MGNWGAGTGPRGAGRGEEGGFETAGGAPSGERKRRGRRLWLLCCSARDLVGFARLPVRTVNRAICPSSLC